MNSPQTPPPPCSQFPHFNHETRRIATAQLGMRGFSPPLEDCAHVEIHFHVIELADTFGVVLRFEVLEELPYDS
jgi:hypothetical protein